MNDGTTISVTSGTLFRILLMGVGVYVFWLLRDLVLLVLTAIIIASALEPGVALFLRARMPRFLAVFFLYAFVFGAVFSVLYFFVPPLIADVADFVSAFPQYITNLDLESQLSTLSDRASFLGDQTELQMLAQNLFSLQSVFAASPGAVAQLVVTFFGGFLSLILVVVLSFYFALQETGVDDFLRLVLPVRHETYAIDLWKRAQKKIGLWMQGQLLLSVIVGILTYLGLAIIGVPYALLLAILAGAAEIIPIFGGLIAGLLAATIAYSHGGVPLALIVIGLYIVINQFESNLIYPLIVKKVVGIPPLLVILALVAGHTLVGFIGILLSVPVAAVLLELLNDFDTHKRRVAQAR